MLWTLAATVSYACTVAIGMRSLRGRRIDRVWHTRLFVLTIALTMLAAAFSLAQDWRLTLLLVAALVPLALLPALTVPVRKRVRRHTILGLSAAPCYLAAMALWAFGSR